MTTEELKLRQALIHLMKEFETLSEQFCKKAYLNKAWIDAEELMRVKDISHDTE